MNKYEVKRETKHHTETVFRGTEKECLDWTNSTITRNKYAYQTTVNLNMDPVWICQDRVFWITKEK